MSGSVQLGESDYRDRVHAAWLGKAIGGTLGAPYEGRMYVLDLEARTPPLTEAAPNDDLDFQLVWLRMLEERGTDPALSDFADYWQSHLAAYPWNEYGLCQRNLARGLRPPISGAFENYRVDEMGSPIRSEIWACLAPGDPQAAAELAWRDSALDHAGGEGMFGEMFWAAVESAAFLVDDPLTLIRIGLAMIPPASNIARVVREAVWCHANGLRWAEARQRILDWFGRGQPCHAVPNHGFMILGWLYGADFGDRLCKAVNCGFDTDCTGATLGSVLGLAGGAAAIPAAWRQAIGERIVLHPYTRPDGLPATLAELTERTVRLARRRTQPLKEESASSDADSAARASEDAHSSVLSRLFRNDLAREALARDLEAAAQPLGDRVAVLHYGGEPVFLPGVMRTVEVGVSERPGFREEPASQMGLEAPAGWRVDHLEEDGARARFNVTPPARFAGARLRVVGARGEAAFVVFSPEESPGFPSGRQVETCPRCHARREACICNSDRAG